ncbi:MAG: heavy metal-binding domain-containing protein [Oscillospiraceae bacterium]|nr:heavy metal-binding domain-containing protein [Oscillospiraceae bacterium]
MLMTTGYDFQGYFITEYIDVVFDEILVGLGFGKSIMSAFDNVISSLTGTEATEMIEKLNNVKYELRNRVIQKAKYLGANALIGIDFESSKLGDLIMVSMTATAVKVDKIISPLPYTVGEKEREEKKEEREKRAKERKERLDSVVDYLNDIFADLKELENVAEMLACIEPLKELMPDIFTEDVMKRLEGCTTVARIYGTKSAKNKVLGIIKEIIDKHQE